MDAEQGLCWRCEMKEATKKCTHCNIAEYCGTQCMDRDKIRHKVECDMWNRDKECARCKKKMKCSSCSACKETAYCSRECQQKHWSSHKVECKQIRKKVKLLAERLMIQFRYHDEMKKVNCTPYYFGNSLAVDVLKLGLNEAEPTSKMVAAELARDYKILFAGVGDLRNLLLTTASLPSNFSGTIRFTLNDIDPFVLARNVLFLYLIITRSSRKLIETAITNIWYSVQLPDEDFRLLTSALSELIGHTAETLKTKTSTYLDIQEEDLQLMKEVWKKWTEMESGCCKWNSINLSSQRSRELIKPGPSEAISTYIRKIPQKYRSSATKYFENGIFLPHAHKKSNLRYDNPTLTGRPWPKAENLGFRPRMRVQTRPKLYNFVYCIRHDLMPFKGWDCIQAEKVSQQDSIVDLFHTYITSVIRSALQYFQIGMIYSKVILSNCTDLCKERSAKPEYDRIMTSNIADYTDIKVLLSSMRPLLSTTNKHAVLVTETLNWVRFCPEADLTDSLNDNKEALLKLPDVVVKDTGRNDLKDIIQVRYDYFDDTVLFTRYLRIVFLAITDELTFKDELPSFPKDFENIEGFRLRNFTKGPNKVIPFRYRVCARLCSNELGVQRNLEWQLV